MGLPVAVEDAIETMIGISRVFALSLGVKMRGEFVFLSVLIFFC